jgi:hypothetical protein
LVTPSNIRGNNSPATEKEIKKIKGVKEVELFYLRRESTRQQNFEKSLPHVCPRVKQLERSKIGSYLKNNKGMIH